MPDRLETTVREDGLWRGYKMDVRDVDDDGHFVGHSNVFGVEDSYGTIFDSGAFKKTIKDHDGIFPVLFFHDPTAPVCLAEHSEDAKGLRVEGKLDLDIELGRRVRSGMKNGYMDCMSIGFRPVSEVLTDGITHFTEVRLWESSILTRNFAATPGAIVDDVRMLPAVRSRIAELSRDAGPGEVAAAIAEFEGLLELLEILPDEGRADPDEHECVLRAKAQYKQFRRRKRSSGGKAFFQVLGQRKDDLDTWEPQAHRYANDVWSEEDARAHCKANDGKKFVAAKKDNALADDLEPSKDTPSEGEPQTNAGEPGDHSHADGLKAAKALRAEVAPSQK